LIKQKKDYLLLGLHDDERIQEHPLANHSKSYHGTLNDPDCERQCENQGRGPELRKGIHQEDREQDNRGRILNDQRNHDDDDNKDDDKTPQGS
jgi:hypothetical protein